MNSTFALVPIELFDDREPSAYLPAKRSYLRRVGVVVRRFDSLGVVGLYAVGEADFIARKLFDLVEYASNNVGETLFALVEDKRLFVVALRDLDLRLANVFEVDGDEDIAYFILIAVQNTGLDIGQTRVKLSSSPIRHSLISLMNRYIDTEPISVSFG